MKKINFYFLMIAFVAMTSCQNDLDQIEKIKTDFFKKYFPNHRDYQTIEIFKSGECLNVRIKVNSLFQDETYTSQFHDTFISLFIENLSEINFKKFNFRLVDLDNDSVYVEVESENVRKILENKKDLKIELENRFWLTFFNCYAMEECKVMNQIFQEIVEYQSSFPDSFIVKNYKINWTYCSRKYLENSFYADTTIDFNEFLFTYLHKFIPDPNYEADNEFKKYHIGCLEKLKNIRKEIRKTYYNNG